MINTFLMSRWLCFYLLPIEKKTKRATCFFTLWIKNLQIRVNLIKYCRCVSQQIDKTNHRLTVPLSALFLITKKIKKTNSKILNQSSNALECCMVSNIYWINVNKVLKLKTRPTAQLPSHLARLMLWLEPPVLKQQKDKL